MRRLPTLLATSPVLLVGEHRPIRSPEVTVTLPLTILAGDTLPELATTLLTTVANIVVRDHLTSVTTLGDPDPLLILAFLHK